MTTGASLKHIRYWGITPSSTEPERRVIELSNLLAMLIAGFTLLVVLALLIIFGWVTSAKLALGGAFFYLAMLILNRQGYTYLNRILQSKFLPIFTLFASILIKRDEVTIDESEYFDMHLILLISAIIPLILFDIRNQWRSLIFALLPSFLGLLFFDFIHNLFDVGYYQTGHNAPNYPFTRTLYLLMYVLLISSFMYYKRLLERTELQLSTSHKKIVELNKALQEQNDSLQAQHEELQAQNEEIVQSREMLHEANKIIEQQKEVLVDENQNLNRHLIEKNDLLEETNAQLQQRLEEVRQFSYTISHNLRGPVASLLGLFNLFNKEKAYPENLVFIKHAETTVNALDTVIQDLSKVLQMRDGLRKSEAVNISQLLDAVIASLQTELNKKNGKICRNLEVQELLTEKAYLHSILYNLISNAIKYASPERPPEIEIGSKRVNNAIQLVVADNGRGIDLNQNEQNLFKLYKRFHLGEEGRGLGLYLVKAQTEALGGKVKVESVLNEGSSFWIYLPQNN